MSVRHMAMCFEIELKVYATDVVSPRTMRDVLIALSDHAHHDGTSAKPSVRLIAWKMDLSERQVHRALNRLEEVGLIEVVGERGSGAVTEWQLRLERASKKELPARRKSGHTGNSSETDSVDTTVSEVLPLMSDKPPGTVEETSSLPAAEIIKHPRVDEVWDELAAQFGPPGTRQAEKERGKVCQQIRGAGVEHAADVVELVAEYRRTFSGEVALTQHALAKHADLLAHQIRQRGSRRQAKPCEYCGVGAGLHAAECPEAEAA